MQRNHLPHTVKSLSITQETDRQDKRDRDEVAWLVSLSLPLLTCTVFPGVAKGDLTFEMPQLEWHVHAEIRLLYSRFFFIVKATCNDAAAALFLTLSGLSAALLFPLVRAIVYRLFVDRTLWPPNVHNFLPFIRAYA